MKKHKVILKVLTVVGVFALVTISNGLIAFPPTEKVVKFNTVTESYMS